jgi:signal transduction histidine kinase/CheY-like chemotaxis protein
MRRGGLQHIDKARRDYNAWVADETMEDYALRFAPRSFRKWSEFLVANTAFGSISFLVLEAIGGALTINYGFCNTFWAILSVGLIIFLTGLPIAYYAARHNIDMDLLTRGAGFGYIGSTMTSLIYASFTFTLFALEASIMSLALELYFGIPLAFAHLLSALAVIPLVMHGITHINRFQLWTQPVWLALLIAPYAAVLAREPGALAGLAGFAGNGRAGFDWMSFGAASTVAFSMAAQIGEQVDFLRFLPEKTGRNRWRWWSAVIVAGPGWIVLGMARQLGGALLAYLAIRHGVASEHAHEPTQMYLVAYRHVFDHPQLGFAAVTLFVVVSQLKINVTNAYAGSLAWSNFFSRLTHSHPGRVVWLVFNVMIALLLMELGVFGALERVLGLFSNVAIAWIGAVVADLTVNKPLGLSPPGVEFRRAHLQDINPVGVVSTVCASAVAITAHLGILGAGPKAFSAYLALGVAFLMAPLIAWATGGRYYRAPRSADWGKASPADPCCVCQKAFEAEDKAYCPLYEGAICSLCCTLDARCHDACKPRAGLNDQLQSVADWCLPRRFSQSLKLRLFQFALLYLLLAGFTGIFVSVIYYQDWLTNRAVAGDLAKQILSGNFAKVYSCLLVFLGLGSWWLVLNNESRQVAQEETNRQTKRLLREVEDHRKTDAKLKKAKDTADRANAAKSRFLSDMSHEIRTPLNSILGYSQLLRKDPSMPTHRQQALEIIERSGEHLSRLIEDILDIARIEARKFELKYAAVDFPGFVEQMLRLFKPQAEAKGLVFRCQIVDALPVFVRGDEKRMGQIIMNLLSNAVKFTHEGEIIFRIGYSGEVAVFQVIDTGEGIPEDKREEIYLPFNRLNSSRGNAAAGSGLGLTVSKIFTEIMGGELTVSGRYGEGTTFTVKLFLPKLHGHIAEAGDDEEGITGYAGRRRKILVVDDHQEHRSLLVSVLVPLGFQLLEAESGESCLVLARAEKPDLILLDVLMGGMSGIKAANQLRQSGYLSPIIIVSANAYPSDRRQAIAADCDNFISKPIQIAEVLRKIKFHLGLDWTYAMNEPTRSLDIEDGGSPLRIPPEAQLAELAEFAKIGDLRGLTERLRQIATDDFSYIPFASHLQSLAREFRLGDIKRLLGRGQK